MRIDARDDFAVELQHQTQHAVRRRMLRPEVDGEIAEVLFVHGQLRFRRIANSEWRIASSFRGLVLQRTYQGAKHFAQALALTREPSANRQPARCRRAPPKADAFPAPSANPARSRDAARSCRYFRARDLPRYWQERSGRAPDLRRQSEQLVARKLARQPIAGLRQGHGVLPYPQVPIRIDRLVVQSSSLFATRHSLFATSFSSPGSG